MRVELTYKWLVMWLIFILQPFPLTVIHFFSISGTYDLHLRRELLMSDDCLLNERVRQAPCLICYNLESPEFFPAISLHVIANQR